MKTLLYWLLLGLGAALVAGAAIAQTPDLYHGEVPVADETPDTRDAALREILRQVMVRISGHRDVMARPRADSVLEKAASLVQQFRYRTGSDPADPGAAPNRYLSAGFDPAALRRAMAQHGLPVWADRRPRVLLWVAISDAAGRRLYDLGSQDEARELVMQRAERRGMPLQFPLLDLRDQAAISAADIWSDYAPAINAASTRYPHDAVLTGRLHQEADGHWQAQWRLWRDGRSQALRSGGDDPAPAVASGIDAAQDRLALQSTVLSGGSSQLTRIRVEGIDGLTAYARLLALVSGQPGITTVHLREAAPDRLLLEVQASGGSEALAGRLAGEPGLAALPPPLDGEGQDQSSRADLHYMFDERGLIGSP